MRASPSPRDDAPVRFALVTNGGQTSPPPLFSTEIAFLNNPPAVLNTSSGVIRFTL
ncbi:MAG: hypothetical protein K0U45_02765 [Alphaproteobacteria bacterium]|nr:hypothetical protein [Alphaproteobacteria bacterium]